MPTRSILLLSYYTECKIIRSQSYDRKAQFLAASLMVSSMWPFSRCSIFWKKALSGFVILIAGKKLVLVSANVTGIVPPKVCEHSFRRSALHKVDRELNQIAVAYLSGISVQKTFPENRLLRCRIYSFHRKLKLDFTWKQNLQKNLVFRNVDL